MLAGGARDSRVRAGFGAMNEIEDRAWAMVLVALVIGSGLSFLMLRGI